MARQEIGRDDRSVEYPAPAPQDAAEIALLPKRPGHIFQPPYSAWLCSPFSHGSRCWYIGYNPSEAERASIQKQAEAISMMAFGFFLGSSVGSRNRSARGDAYPPPPLPPHIGIVPAILVGVWGFTTMAMMPLRLLRMHAPRLAIVVLTELRDVEARAADRENAQHKTALPRSAIAANTAAGDARIIGRDDP